MDLLAVPSEPLTRKWTDRETLLYALSIGAGSADPAAELQFTTENSAGIEQQVIPTFACLLALARSPRTLGDFDAANLVHAEESVVFHSPVAPSGEAVGVTTLRNVYDKGKSALLVEENVALDAATGQPLVTTTSKFMVFGEGGFGGDRGPATESWNAPDRDPDFEVAYTTRRDQPLLYRLTGDRNPMHSDPSVAVRAGYVRPIMHGMCTYGFVCRALVQTVADGDASLLKAMSARFSKPAVPGDTLIIRIWRSGSEALFRVFNPSGEVILDRGTAQLSS